MSEDKLFKKVDYPALGVAPQERIPELKRLLKYNRIVISFEHLSLLTTDAQETLDEVIFRQVSDKSTLLELVRFATTGVVQRQLKNKN